MLFTTTLLCGHGPHGSGLVAIYWASSTFGWTTQTDGDGDGIGELEMVACGAVTQQAFKIDWFRGIELRRDSSSSVRSVCSDTVALPRT